MNCLWCNVGFEPKRPWQKFCCPEHQKAFNAKSGQDGIKLPPVLQRELEALAEGQEISVREMLCKIIHQTINPGQRPLNSIEIYGKPNAENTKQGGA